MPLYNTQIDQIGEQLEDLGEAEVLGEHQAYFFISPNREKYLVKKSLNLITHKKDPEYYHFLEALASRFYDFFSPETYTAKTKLIKTSTGEVNIGSLWIDEFIPYDYITLPFIQDGKIISTINSKAYEIHGYISMLLTAKLIGNYDCIGKGINAGVKYNKEKDIYENVKIDTGGSFLFVSDNPINHIFGMLVEFTHKIEKIYHQNGNELPDFATHIPLELIDSGDATKLDELFNKVNIFIDYFYPNFDVRDLLIDKLSYNEIKRHKELYHQFVFAVHKLVHATNEDLVSLIYEEMPESINGEDLKAIKSNIYDQIKLRQETMAQIYKAELEYYKLYVQFSDSMTFEVMKFKALINADIFSETSPKLMDEEQINIAQRQFSRLVGNKIDQYEISTGGIAPKEISLLFSTLKDLINSIESEDLNLVRAILKNRPSLASKINFILTIEENHGTSAILRTKKHMDLKTAELLLDHGVNPRKQILYQENEDGSIEKIYFDIVYQLPENLQALILQREIEMSCSFLEIEDLEIIEEEFNFFSESNSEFDEEERTLDQEILNINYISEIVGQRFLDEVPNYFLLFTQKSGSLVLKYLNSLTKELDLILEYIENIDLTIAMIFHVEDVFNSLNGNISPWHIYLGSGEIIPEDGYYGGDYGGSGYEESYHHYDNNPPPYISLLVGKSSSNATTDK